MTLLHCLSHRKAVPTAQAITIIYDYNTIVAAGTRNSSVHSTKHIHSTKSETRTHTAMSSDAQAVYRPYIISPLPLCGVEVRGIDLRKDVDPETVAVIKRDVAEYRLVLFRDQGVVSGHRQVDISRWFGELDCPFHKHPASPHPEVGVGMQLLLLVSHINH